MKKKHRFKEFEKRVFTITFVPTTGEWTRLRTASSAVHLTNYFSGDKIRKSEMGGGM